MKYVLLIALLLLACGAQASTEAPRLSPAMHLRKIKFRLLGQDPDSLEYRELLARQAACARETASEACLDRHLRAKIREYMSRPEFVGRGVELVNSLLYLAPFPGPFERVKPTGDALTLLVERVFRENMSWTKLFTANEYDVIGLNPGLHANDVHYFTQFIPDALKPVRAGDRLRVKIPGEDIAAGILTTIRMSLRFYNTPVNEGRKRAAAIMRLGLCDDMFPAIERGDEHQQVEDQIAKGKKFEDIVAGMKDTEIHGQKRDCAQCHVYRSLDHLAWTFRGTELSLDPEPAPGRFTYLMPDGKVVDEPVRGLGHYARVLARQEPFIPCQVQTLWSEYVGEAASLKRDPDLSKRLAAEYQREGAGVQDVLEYMMMLPEFRTKSRGMLKDPRFKAAERILVNCNSCHSTVPSFTNLPIMERGQDRTQHYVGRIIERLALAPYARATRRSMPPRSSPWHPTDDDVKAVLTWIEAGAPDATGKQFISLEWLESLKQKGAPP